jgi:hypothetical protein
MTTFPIQRAAVGTKGSARPKPTPLIRKQNRIVRLASALAAVAIAAITPVEAATVFKETGGIVVMEAEHFDSRQNSPDGHRYAIIPDEVQLGQPGGTPAFKNARGSYIMPLPDTVGGGVNNNGADGQNIGPFADYKVNITTTGEYRLWLRWGGYDGSSDSMYAQILENTTPPTWYRYSRNIANDFATDWFGTGGADSNTGGPDATDGPTLFTISTPGTYTIRLSMREDGSGTDALIFQLSSLADPGSGIGQAESDLTEGIIASAPANQAAVPPATATFTANVKTGPGATATYQWQSAPPGSTVFADIAGATSASYTTPATTLAMNGTQYRFKATSAGTTVTSGAGTLTTDATPPTVAYVFSTGPTSLRVAFSEPLNATSATTAGNYSVAGLATSNPTLSADGKIVTLTTAAQTPAAPYTLTVNGVKDLAGNALNNGTANFVGATILTQEKTIEHRYWNNINNNNVSALKADPRYPSNPTSVTFEPLFEYPPAGGSGVADNYGNRLAGWLNAPEDGDYVFFTCSDDPSELWLSTDEDPTHKLLIARETSWSNARQWINGGGPSDPAQRRSDTFTATQWPTKDTVNGGAQITLQKGKHYYVEVLHTEGGGGDNVGVNWRLPSAAGVDPVDSDPPISADFVDQIYTINGAVNITTQPQSQSKGANSAATFTVAATAVDNSGLTYVWQSAPKGSSTFTGTGVVGASLTTPLLTAADDGTQYRVLVLSASGAALSSVATLTVTADNVPPTVAYFGGMRTTALIVFDEPIDTTTAQDLNSYSIAPSGSITAATASTAPSGVGVVTLDLSGLKNFTNYTITIKNVKDTANNVMVQTTKTFTAYDISSDFNAPVPPPKSTLTGVAKMLPAGGSDGSGVLELTPNVGGLQGTIGIDDVLGGDATNVTIKVKLFIGNGSGDAADGLSINVAGDIDATTATAGEDGTGSGLSINFDTYNNAGAGNPPEAPAVEVKWAGAIVTLPDGVTPAQTIVTKGTLVNNQWVDVFIQLLGDPVAGTATVTVIHNNVKYFDNLPIAGFAAITNPKIAIGARTGGELETHWIDNLVVLYNDTVPAPEPPTISITSPTNNQELAAGAPVTVTVNAAATEGVTKVEFYANGTLLGQSTTAPYSFTVPGAVVTPGLYAVTAKITDNSGVAVTSAAVNVIVRPVGAPKALFLHANAGPNASDIAAINHLFARGFDTYAMGAANATTADGDGKALVMISSSVTSNDVGDKFRTAAVPVFSWENALQDNFQFVPDTATDHNTVVGRTDLVIDDPASPLAGGLSGTVVVTSNAQDQSWALNTSLPAGALKAASTTEGLGHQAIYGIDKGGALIDGTTAAARRAHVFMTDNSFANLTADGLKLVDAAITWLTATSGNPQPAQLSASVANNSLTITWTNGGTLEWTSAIVPGGTWTTTGDSDGSYSEAVNTAQNKFFRVRNP